MKYLIAIILTALALTANAQHRPYPHHGHGGAHGWGWVAPALVGGAVVYAATRPPVVVQQPVVVQPAPVAPYYGQTTTCTAWTEIQTPDGRIYRERICTQ
jgi:hypothetical protein